MNSDLCIVWGPAITVLVMLLKKIPFLTNLDPKWLAGLFSILAVAVPLLIKGELGGQIVTVALCIAAVFGVSIGTYEVGKSTLALKKTP